MTFSWKPSQTGCLALFSAGVGAAADDALVRFVASDGGQPGATGDGAG